MGVFNFEDETTSTVAPSTLYKALVKDSDNLIPKVIDVIKSVEIVEGNGGAGTIKKLTFVEGRYKYIYVTFYSEILIINCHVSLLKKLLLFNQ